MHIGTIHFYNRSFPPEIRLEKESRALIKAGHKITVLTHRMSEKEAEYEEWETNFFVKRAYIRKPDMLSEVLSKFTFMNKEYVDTLREFIHDFRPDVLIVHDFNQVPTVLRVAVAYKIPVIADLHENMPAALIAYRSEMPPVKKWLHSVLYNYFVWRQKEADLLPRCSRILVVVPEAAEVLYELGVPKEKIVVICNTEDETTFKMDPEQADPDIISSYKDSWMVSYVGGIAPHRGIKTVLKALPYLKDNIPGFKLVIVGAREEQKNKILSEAGVLNVEKMVQVIGWQPFNKVNSYVIASSVCLVPHDDFEHTHTTIPHKLFQYMICSKPVLVSDCRPLKRVVEDSGSGIVFEASNPRDLAEKLIYMYKNPERLKAMGQRGKESALGKYAWRHDAEMLVKTFEGVQAEIGK